jgi:hypothetical protein
MEGLHVDLADHNGNAQHNSDHAKIQKSLPVARRFDAINNAKRGLGTSVFR